MSRDHVQSSTLHNTALVSKQKLLWLLRAFIWLRCKCSFFQNSKSGTSWECDARVLQCGRTWLKRGPGNRETHHAFFMLFIGGLICHHVFFPQIVKLTIYRMLPKNLLRRTLMQRLHLFPDDVSGHTVTFSSFLLRRWRALAKLQS